MSALVPIREKVENALMNDNRTQDETIEVINHQGIVTLVGKVKSEEIAQAAEDVTKSQDGVIKVINSLVFRN